LGDYGVFQIGFTGGEPTLRKDIHELMRFTESIGCVCNLTTNGWFLSEDFVKEMAKTEIKQCQISVDSFNEDIHDRLRGKGSLNRAIKAIKLLQKYQIHVGIDCVVSKNNIKEVAKKIAGKYPNLAENYLSSIPGFVRAEFRIKPLLPGKLGTLPHVAGNMSIEFSKE